MHGRPILLGLLVVSLATGCAGGAGGAGGIALAKGAAARTSANPEDATKAGSAINAFGYELLRAATEPGENAVLSPASIVLALGMARPGARGETAAQIDAVLREVASDGHASWLNALDTALASRSGTFKDFGGKDSEVSLRIANTTFAQRDVEWNQAYLDAIASRFGAGVHLVDYTAAAEAARTAINAWVAERTEQRIPELLAEGTIDDLTRLVLVNAIYLKAAWQTPFEVAATSTGPFTRLDGSTLDVAYMRQLSGLPYASGPGWRAVQLPYVGGSLAMTIIVPDDLAAFEAGLDDAAFEAIAAALEPQQVQLSFPKFGIETRADLGGVLAAMGMPLAFDPNGADFSGMTAEERLFISAVIHQANIDVDEKGTTAAAATAVAMRTTSMPAEPIVLNVDRPFLFALRDLPTGAILFVGRVTEPAVRG